MIWQGIEAATARARVVALGNFDGVHRGHQAVLGLAVQVARRLHLPAAVLVLDPHPVAVLRPHAFQGLLTPLPERALLIGSLGVEEGFLLPFDGALARMDPERFVREILLERLHVRAVVSGQNYHYGHEGRGDVAALRADGERLGFEVHVAAPVSVGGGIVSASRIRALLATGDTMAARTLLGRPYSVRGMVESGDARGRQLGFPTANVVVAPEFVLPRFGVYAVYVAGHGRGVANLGPRPTVGKEEPLLEVHLFTPPPPLLGHTLTVAFGPYLRPQIRFPDLEALVEQIARDKEAAASIAFLDSDAELW